MDQGIHKVKLFKMKNEKTTWIFFFYEYGIYGGQKFLKCVDFIINKKEIIRIVKINKQNYGKNTFPIKKIPNPITDHTISQKFIPNS